jgi:hyperosmotically inducible periplasmic protein
MVITRFAKLTSSLTKNMGGNVRTRRIAFCVAILVFVCFDLNAQSGSTPQLATRPGNSNVNEQRIAKEVRHELVMLPYYSVFDDLEFQVNGDTVVLSGAVVNPTLKSDAERVVKKVDGVNKVVNQIKVLPPSPNDDEIRRRVARAIFSQDGLFKYSWSAVPPIHIIVDNGHVTLKGVVDNPTDKNLAYIAANQVPGVFSVDNQLQVAESSVAKK